MSQSEYFINKLTPKNKNLLYENPDEFLASHIKQLTITVRDDMNTLSAIVTPVHAIEYHSDQWDSWTNHTYWYHVKQQDKKEIAANMFDLYYSMCGLQIPYRYDLRGNTVFELGVDKIEDDIFNCLRAVYFHDNKGKWGMGVPGNQNLCPNGQMYVDDFADYNNGDYRLRYTKQQLDKQIKEHCTNIAKKATDVINRDVWAEKRQTDTAREEIAHAYATLKKYRLPIVDNTVKKY